MAYEIYHSIGQIAILLKDNNEFHVMVLCLKFIGPAYMHAYMYLQYTNPLIYTITHIV